MTYCGERCLSRQIEGGYLGVTLFCHSWTCPNCADNRQRQLIAEAVGGNPNIFLTLTIRRSEAATPTAAAKKLSAAFQTMRRRIMYWHKRRKFPFFAVFERHVSGWPHLHIFLRTGWLDQAELSCWMSHLLNSPIVHIRKIDNQGRAAAYAAKYTTKENVRFGTAKRYWQSPDYDVRKNQPQQPPLTPGFRWERQDCSLHALVAAWRAFGYAISIEGTHRASARAPP